MSKSWAKELGEEGIRVNIISPGPIDTGIWYKTDMSTSDEEKNKQGAISGTALGRLGKPEDIAEAALYLVSDKGSYITGANILVDGGAGI